MRDARIAPRRLLLIDDYAPFRTTLGRLLQTAGHTVYLAEGGSAGMALLRREPVDVVLTDLDMPGLTGWDVALLVKTVHRDLPVVVLTGGGMSARTCTQGTRPPVDAVLEKPFAFADLQALIERLTLASPPLQQALCARPARQEPDCKGGLG